MFRLFPPDPNQKSFELNQVYTFPELNFPTGGVAQGNFGPIIYNLKLIINRVAELSQIVVSGKTLVNEFSQRLDFR